MSKLGTRWGWLSGIVTSGVYIWSTHCASAQITPDATLPNNSIVTPSGNTINITGGTQAGGNLFHSFKDFSLPTGSEAFFNNTVDIANIISRVTGSSISNIDGLIRANGIANLFLINPNGIVFGPNARLNIGGSFIGSTASSLKFADGTEFSATNPIATPLLTISVPMGLQFGANPREIKVTGLGHEIVYERVKDQPRPRVDSNITGLGIESGKTLALVGGNVSIEGGVLKSPVGRIEIGSVGSNGVVSLVPVQQGWKLDYEGTPSFADIQFSRKPFVSTTGSGGGSIAVVGRNIDIIEQSIVLSDTLGERNGGEISIVGDKITVNESDISTNTFSAGDAGPIKLIAKNSILLDNLGGAGNHTGGLGKAGEITLKADSIIIRNRSGLGSNTYDVGNAGRIEVKANSLLIEKNSGFGTSSAGQGTAGEINIEVGKFELRNSSGLESAAKNAGNGGQISITANTFLIEEYSGLSSRAEQGSTGNAGEININAADSVMLRKYVGITSNTLGRGNAGKITITANSLLLENSGISTNTEQDSTGKAGEINFKVAGSFDLKSASISTNTMGVADGVKINISAKKLQMQDASISSAANNIGRGGDIELQIGNLLLLRRQNSLSSISTTATGSGDGGNISINVPNGFIVTVPNENSDITANAFSGGGGKITIKSLSNFGIRQRSREDLSSLLETTDPNQLKPESSLTNDITAFSQTSPTLEGQVIINTPDVDPSKGFVELPTLLADISEVIDTSCAAFAEGEGNKFTITGRGGLPPSPNEPLSPDVVWSDTRTRAITTQQQAKKEPAGLPQSKPEAIKKIVPATGWVFNGKGQVTLISHASNANGMETPPANCPKP